MDENNPVSGNAANNSQQPEPQIQSAPQPEVVSQVQLGAQPEPQAQLELQPHLQSQVQSAPQPESQLPQDQAAVETTASTDNTQSPKNKQNKSLAIIITIFLAGLLVSAIVMTVMLLGNNGGNNGDNEGGGSNEQSMQDTDDSNITPQISQENTEQIDNTGSEILNDDYFVSDSTKLVLTMEADDLYDDDAEGDDYMTRLVRTHLVYTYSGETITGEKIYFEYIDNATAKQAFDAIKTNGEDITQYTVNGKYVIMTATVDQFEGITTSDLRSQIEYLEALKYMDSEELDDIYNE